MDLKKVTLSLLYDNVGKLKLKLNKNGYSFNKFNQDGFFAIISILNIMVTSGILDDLKTRNNKETLLRSIDLLKTEVEKIEVL